MEIKVAMEKLKDLNLEPDSSISQPLYSLFPREVQGKDVRRALDHDLNPFLKAPHTARYKKILETRKKLPVFAQMDEFMEMFNKNQVIIVAGETGSGKTTQIPQFVAFSDLPHTRGRMIACTQSRRLSAVCAASRVADEMDVQLGGHVGYSIRFEDMTEPGTTFLKYMTDGMLLREAMHDNSLEHYSTIILDDAHERTLATDILIGLLKDLVKRRADLKIIIMSATLDAVKFQKYFSLHSELHWQVPLFKALGRTHPVEIFYTQAPEPDYFECAVCTVLMIHQSEESGDILLFLTGEEEIEDACRKFKLEADDSLNKDPDSMGPLVCIPLYASLPPQQQQRVFDPAPKQQREGGPLVEKSSFQRMLPRHQLLLMVLFTWLIQDSQNRRSITLVYAFESLLVSRISKASAQRRAGRAGRTRPGKCFRLYTEKDFIRELEDQLYPEILRSNLATTVLELVNLGIKDLVQFDYLDAPAPESLMRALELLNFLAAMDDDGNLTALGKLMAEFPLEPQLAKVLISSPEFGCSNEILTIVATLYVPNIWQRPRNHVREADAAKEMFNVPESDHLTLLNVYNRYILNKYDESWARMNYLSERTLSEAENVRNQLQRIMERLDIDLVSLDDETQLFLNVRKALVSGFFMQVAHREGSGTRVSYTTVKDHQVVGLHPSCGLKTQPEWLLFHEFVLTTRPFLRTVTEVRGEWLLEHAPLYFDLKTFPSGKMKRSLLRIERNLGKRRTNQERRTRGRRGH